MSHFYAQMMRTRFIFLKTFSADMPCPMGIYLDIMLPRRQIDRLHADTVKKRFRPEPVNAADFSAAGIVRIACMPFVQKLNGGMCICRRKTAHLFLLHFNSHVENEHRYDKSQSPPVINRRTFSDIFHHTTSFHFFYSTFIPYNNKILFIYMKYSFKKYVSCRLLFLTDGKDGSAQKKDTPFQRASFPLL